MRLVRWQGPPAAPVTSGAVDAVRGGAPWWALGACLAVLVMACGATPAQAPPTAPVSAASTASAAAAVAATGMAGASAPASFSIPASAPASTTASIAPVTAAPTPEPSGTVTVRGATAIFTSHRYGYSVAFSASDWLVRETPGAWNGIFESNPLSTTDSGTDWLRNPGVATIEIGVLDVPAGTTVAAWEASEAPSVRMLACTEAASAETATVAEERALLLPETCPKVVVGENAGNQYFLNAFLVHGTRALIAQWRSEQGHEAADRATFLRILGTLRWG